MAFLGGLPGILAAGTTAGLGTAEEQRARQDAIMRFGLNLAQQQAQLAETKRQHDLQYEPVDITSELNVLREQVGQPPLPPGTVKMPRGRATGFPAAYAGMLKEPPVNVGDVRNQMKGLGLDVPDLPSETITGAGEAGPPEFGVPGEIPSITRPTAESQTILGTRVPRADIPLLRGSLADRAKANREAAIVKAKDDALSQFNKDIQPKEQGGLGSDKETAFWKNNLARFGMKLNDVLGPEAKPDQRFSLEQRAVEILGKPEADRTAEEKSIIAEYRAQRQPDVTSEAIKAERLKALILKREMDTLMQDVEKALAEGKPIPLAQKSLWTQRLTSSAQTFLRAAELTDENKPEEKQMWKDTAKEILLKARQLNLAAGGPAKPGESVGDVAKRLRIPLK